MRKKLTLLLSMCMTVCVGVGLTACDEEPNGGNTDPHVHELVFHEYKEWNCTESGNNPYYSCKGCDACFDDESMSVEREASYYLQPATGHVYSSGICFCGEKDPNYVNGGLTQAQIEYMFKPANFNNITIWCSDRYGSVTIKFAVINGRDVVYYESTDNGEEIAQYIIYDNDTEELKTYTVVYESESFTGEIVECVLDETAEDTPRELIASFFELPSNILKHYYTMSASTYEGNCPGYYIEQFKTYVDFSVGLEFYARPDGNELLLTKRYRNGELSSTTYYDFDEPVFSLPLMIDPDHTHEYTWGDIVDPATCTEDGLERGVCDACGGETTRPIKAAGHEYSQEWSKDKTYHWKAAVCGCADAGVSEKGEHVFVEGECQCGRKAFTEGLAYIYDDDNKTCTVSGIGTATAEDEIVIPAKIGEYTVTEVGSSAFKNQTQITRIDLPDTIAKISSDAFKGCSGLTGIDIPETTTINTSVFGGCSSLVEMALPLSQYGFIYLFGSDNYDGSYKVSCLGATYYIPESLKTVTVKSAANSEIAGYAFYGCKSLTQIYLNGEMTRIGEAAFMLCSGLTSIVVPEGVTQIDCWAFDGSGLVGIDLPESLTSVLGGAFENCVSLKNITIPNGVSSIGFATFSGCAGLESITLPFVGSSDTATFEEKVFGYVFGQSAYEGGVATEQKYFKGGTAYYETFYLPQKLTTVTVTSGSIPHYAFYNCDNLVTVKFAEGVEKLGSYILMDCASVTSVIVSATVREFEHMPFFDCDSLAAIYYEGSLSEWNEITFNYAADKDDERVYYYSAEDTDGERCWHYGADGVTPVVWGKES